VTEKSMSMRRIQKKKSATMLRAAITCTMGLGIALLCTALAQAQAANSKLRRHKMDIVLPLTAYLIDVEGGQSTLILTPEGQSMLIDTGWPDHDGRDAKRIAAVAKLAGLDHIDFVLITHYHTDHVGGVPQLLEHIPVVEFIDHGPLREPGDAATSAGYNAYQLTLAQANDKHVVATPGMKLPLFGISATVVSADGNLIQTPLPGAGQANPYCSNNPPHPSDETENARSVGVVFQYGKMRMIDLGDLTWDKEMQLVCPVNKLGKVDVYIVSHHGWEHSGSPAFVDGIAPRVALMDNGEHKGGSPSTWEILEKSPRLQNLWQLHYSAEGGAKHNVAAPYLANLQGKDTGNYLKLTAYPNGRLVVFNSRTGTSKNYPAP
jgi:competence protein ComEC